MLQRQPWHRQSSATLSYQENNKTVADDTLVLGCWTQSGTPTSKLNRTPPMGAPKATEIPAAAAADRTSRFLATKLVIMLDNAVWSTNLHCGRGFQKASSLDWHNSMPHELMGLLCPAIAQKQQINTVNISTQGVFQMGWRHQLDRGI